MRIITYGTFDLLHYGHIELLRRAKEFGDYLIVGLSTDSFNYIKGKTSKLSYDKRKQLLESIKYVDEIIPEKDWYQKLKDITEHKIDLLVMGDDWKGKFDYLPCKVIYLKRTKNISSSILKEVLSNE